MPLTSNVFAFLLVVVVFLCIILLTLLVRIVSTSRRLSKEDDGQATAFMTAAMQDAVTRMRAQERALEARAEASERLSDQIIDSLPSGLLVTDRTAVPTRINPAAARLLGLDGPDGLASLWQRLGTSGQGVRALVDECLSTGTPVLRRTIVIEDGRAPGGRAQTRHLGAGVSPLRDSRGDVTGAICLFTDLTAIVDLEEQLRLKDSLSRLGELTAGLAHEFRNGLATIHGYARLIERGRLDDEHRTYIDSVRAETESLTEIVANFLAFAKPSAHTPQAVDVGPIVERAAGDLRAEAETAGGAVLTSGEFGRVEADDVLLRQALSNLIRNAIEACHGAGTAPRVTVEGIVDREAEVQRILIGDNGPGVPPDIADQIFRPFFTTRGQGTGLGLALVQKIIVSHNGRVTVGPSGAGGAEFAIALPLAQRNS